MDSVERRLSDAKLAASIDNAMQRLPKRCTLLLVLQHRWCRVCVASEKRGAVWFDCSEISEAIADAVEWANNARSADGEAIQE